MDNAGLHGGSRRAGVLLLSVTAAVACCGFFRQLASSERQTALISVLGINLGFFAELRAGQYAPGFPTGGDVQWLNSEVGRGFKAAYFDVAHCDVPLCACSILMFLWSSSASRSLRRTLD